MGTHPRQRVRTLVVTTPANTAIATPQSTTWTMGQGALERIDVVIPAGHVGLTGFQLLWGGRQVIPYEEAEWLTGNDDEVTIDLGLWTGVGVLTVRTYNTDDAFEHSHHLRAYVSDGLLFEEPFVVPLVPIASNELGPPSELADEEWDEAVSAASEAFLLELQSILDGFLLELRITLGETPVLPEPGITPEPEPEAEVPPTAPPTEERIQVPDTVGLERARARDRLTRAGFTVNVELRTERGAAGVVIDQQPRGGAMRPRGFTVTITVRRNPR